MLEIGQAYYRLTYADPDQTIPGLTPMIYISDDLFPTDMPDIQTYFFQDTVSYRLIGSAADSESSRSESDIQIQIYTATAGQLGNSVLELREAIAALQDALVRQKAIRRI